VANAAKVMDDFAASLIRTMSGGGKNAVGTIFFAMCVRAVCALSIPITMDSRGGGWTVRTLKEKAKCVVVAFTKRARQSVGAFLSSRVRMRTVTAICTCPAGSGRDGV